MDRDEDQRRAFEEAYRSLSHEERRRRIILEPAFRDAYNEITRADRIAVVPQYFWEKWVPVLGPVPSMLYMRLRQYCYHNPATGERRIECWPKQATLAREIGVKNRKTVAEALCLLESLGFIERVPTYRARGEERLVHRGADKYRVFFEVPLVAEDGVELLMRRMSESPLDCGKPDVSEKRTYRDMSEKRTHIAARKTDSRTSTRTSTSNVTNVGKSSYVESPLRKRPEVQALKPEERANREGLALEVGESLKTWGKGWDGKAHRSEGFHRRVAFLLPEHLVREALAATRDAVERRRSGQGGCHHGPSAYFAGVVKKLAAEAGIDLGLRAEGAESPIRAPERPQGAGIVAVPARESAEPTMNAEEAKRGLRELMERLAAEKR